MNFTKNTDDVIPMPSTISLDDPNATLFVSRIKNLSEGMCLVHIKCYACGWNTVVKIARSTLSYDLDKIYNWHQARVYNHKMKLN